MNVTYSQYSKGGELKSVAVAVQLETVVFARAAVLFTRAEVPFTRAAVLFASAEHLASGIAPAKHLSVFHQLPQVFHGTSLAIDKNR